MSVAGLGGAPSGAEWERTIDEAHDTAALVGEAEVEDAAIEGDESAPADDAAGPTGDDGARSVEERIASFATDLVAKLPGPVRRLLAEVPNVGEIGGAIGLGRPAVLRMPEAGESSALPMIVEIPVGPVQDGVLPVGKKVYDKLFAGYPPFHFNVNFSCAKAKGLTLESDYTDPRSPWFNVFFGRYQIDAPIGEPGAKDAWTRPFGFAEDGRTVCFEDLTRIGNADWGYFSNWMYGVPEEDLDRVLAQQKDLPPPVCTVTNERVTIGGRDYVECVVDGIHLPSAYLNGRDGKVLLDNDPGMTSVWRAAFGRQKDGLSDDPALAAKESSFATEMQMKLYMRTEKRWDDEQRRFVYSTEIYGGGVNKTWAGDDPGRQAFNERFLEAQMAAVRETMPRG